MTSLEPNNNIYLDEVKQSLPRMLSLFDLNPVSPSYGFGDRFYSSWKLIDFANGTFQGAAHGLSRLFKQGMLSDFLDQQHFLELIEAIFLGTKRIMAKNGSLVEAFPNEASFCVTGLVAFDLLNAVDLLSDTISETKRNEYIEIIKPMVRFLYKAEETHGIISNHLATTATALFLWHKLTQDSSAEQRGKQLLAIILEHQSPEGWFQEYQGADPGYQSLCTYYLAFLHRLRPDLNLQKPLQNSLKFLAYFAHPNGSFGGIYGSRNVRIYCPAGVLALRPISEDAVALAQFMHTGIQKNKTVTLSCIDEPNLIPYFNAYCWAAQLDTETSFNTSVTPPCQHKETFQKFFKDAGLVIHNTERDYTIVSTHKGGVIYHFNKEKQSAQINCGALLKTNQNQFIHTQSYCKQNTVSIDRHKVTIKSHFYPLDLKTQTPSQFIILRLLCISLFKVNWLNHWLKNSLVKYVITGSKKSKYTNTRTITLDEHVSITDENNLPTRYKKTKITQFSCMHMASQGYWQKID